MADFVKNGHFLGSGMTCDWGLFVFLVSTVRWLCLLKEQTRPGHSWPKKWLFFTKSAVKKSNSYFLVKVLICPNSLNVRASTNVKRGQKFQMHQDLSGSTHVLIRFWSCFSRNFWPLLTFVDALTSKEFGHVKTLTQK